MRRQLPGTSPISAGALVRALTGALTTPGVQDRLRDLLARRFDATEVALYGSGTQALQAAMAAAHREAGGLVALPGYTCFDMATAAVGAGVPVTLYDVDPATLAPDPDSLEAALRAGARVAVAANLYGFPLDWGLLRDMAGRHGAVLVEDAAQGVGSRWREEEGGTFGDLTVLSFGRGKGWTGGGGGALLARGGRVQPPGPPRVAASSLRALAVGLAHWTMGRPSLFWLPHAIPGLHLGETVYHDPGPLTGIAGASAALVLATEDLAAREVALRRDRAAEWRAALLGVAGITVPRPVADGLSADLRFPVLAPSRRDGRAALPEPVQRFGAAPGYPAVLRHIPALAGSMATVPQRSLEGAEALAARLFTLPTHALVSEADLGHVTVILREITE